MYCDMEVQHTGIYPGVEIKFMSDKECINVSGSVFTSNEFAEAETVITEENDDNADSCVNGTDGNGCSNVMQRGGTRMCTDNGRESNETSARGSLEATCTDGSENNSHEEDSPNTVGNENCGGDMSFQGEQSVTGSGMNGRMVVEVDNGSESTPSKKRKGKKTQVNYIPIERGHGKQDGIMECKKCGKLFSRKIMFERHYGLCMENKERKLRDVIEIAIEKAFDMVYEDHTASVCTRQSMNPEMAKIDFQPERDCRKIRRGWACRPKWGTALGENTIDEFKVCVKVWFDTGSAYPKKNV